MKYKSNNNIVYSCKYHVVFCPKYRRKVLNNGVDERLKELINNICQELHVDLIEMEVMPDHVHLLLEVDPQFGIHKVVKRIKGISSRILREEFSWLKSRYQHCGQIHILYLQLVKHQYQLLNSI